MNAGGRRGSCRSGRVNNYGGSPRLVAGNGKNKATVRHYMMSVLKRGFGIVFPKNYWGPWADEYHPRYRDLLQTFARSPFEFALNYPVTALLGVAGRIMDWLVLPIGAIWGILALWKRPQAVVFLPFLYTLATLAPVYVTSRNTTNAYAAILPLCAFGLIRLEQRVKNEALFRRSLRIAR